MFHRLMEVFAWSQARPRVWARPLLSGSSMREPGGSGIVLHLPHLHLQRVHLGHQAGGGRGHGGGAEGNLRPNQGHLRPLWCHSARPVKKVTYLSAKRLANMNTLSLTPLWTKSTNKKYKLSAFMLDFADCSSRLFDECELFFNVKCIDLLVNNAGVNTMFGWRKCMEVSSTAFSSFWDLP